LKGALDGVEKMKVLEELKKKIVRAFYESTASAGKKKKKKKYCKVFPNPCAPASEFPPPISVSLSTAQT